MSFQYCPYHAKAALIHSQNRAYERYSVELSEYDIFHMSSLVMDGKGTLKRKQANRATFKLNYLGRNFVIIFDYILMIIVTFLPHKALKDFG